MSLSTNSTYRFLVEKLGASDPDAFIGNAGEVFYDPSVATLKLSDGSTAGGTTIGGGGGESYWESTGAGINTSSNVGVGTTNPQTKLQVGGVIGFNDTNIRIGDNTTGASITSGTSNIFMGVGAGNSTTTGSCNNFLGREAGEYNTTGNNNNFLGYLAGYYNTGGSNNNFFGFKGGYSNTTGKYNNFFGWFGGFSNTTGENNNFFGREAGYYNTEGSYNNFFGFGGGYSNTTGNNNNFFGRNAGKYNTTGRYDNFLGVEAGKYNTTGESNAILGNFAGYYNTTGSYNSFFGDGAGHYNTTGNNNVFLGKYSGISTSASNKIIIGSGETWGVEFDSPDTTKDTQFAVGVRTDSNPSNYWIVGDENFNVGVGTTNPTSKLTVQNGDIKVGVNTSEGLILTDSNGVAWRLIVNTDGTLTTTAV
jgi:hypothetical protein